MRILSISCVYPNPLQPTLGTFIRARLTRLARLDNLKVVAPVPVLTYGDAAKWRVRRADIRACALEMGVEVFRPRWFYPPLGGVANAAFLAAALIPIIRKIRSDFRFDIFDAHFGFPDGIATAYISRALNVPYSITLRGNEPMHAEFPARRRAIRWAIRNAAQIIAVSTRLAQFAIGCGACPEAVRIIPNGVDTDIFRPRPENGAIARLGILPYLPVVLSAGYLIERKGHHHVMRAVASLRDAGLHAQLVIAGGPGAEGNYEPVLRQLAQDLNLNDRVCFTGSVPPETLAELMSAASVACLASSREGWPNVVNEALACGTPVIATNVGGVPDMVSSDEIGIVISSSDSGAVQQALAVALGRTWDRGRIAAWGQSRSWEQVACEVHTALEEASFRMRGAQ